MTGPHGLQMIWNKSKTLTLIRCFVSLKCHSYFLYQQPLKINDQRPLLAAGLLTSGTSAKGAHAAWPQTHLADSSSAMHSTCSNSTFVQKQCLRLSLTVTKMNDILSMLFCFGFFAGFVLFFFLLSVLSFHKESQHSFQLKIFCSFKLLFP